MVYATTKTYTLNNGISCAKNAVLIHTFSKISLPWRGPLSIVGRFAPSHCPLLTNPGYTTATGVAKGVRTRAHAHPFPIDWTVKKKRKKGGSRGLNNYAIIYHVGSETASAETRPRRDN